MKLFWKQFITMVCFIIVAFMIFGNIIVYTSFQMIRNREIERSIEEIKIFQYALLASLEGLPKEYQATDMAAVEIVKSIQQSLEMRQNTIIIYNDDKEIIYQNKELKGQLIDVDRKGKTSIWQISEMEGSYYLETLSEVKSSVGSYYLEMNKNIGFIYEEREKLYDSYKMALAVVFVIFMLLSLLFSMSFTRPIRRLSFATREFAKGNYKSRVKEKGNDEVAVLIHDFNQMADELENNIKQLEENARQQEEFIVGFSHELKTPLTSIMGYADMLRSMNLSEEDSVLSADYIFKQGKRLERMALKMMELSYIDKQDITIQEIKVGELVEQIKKMTKELLQKKSVKFTVQAEDGVIYGDADWLLSLFSNLIDNGRKACKEDGEIILKGRKKENGYEFCVKDNGEGMPEEEVGKITEAFYMIDKSRARKEGGAGMGMALCKKIIKLHHAEWKIESHLGKGTEITIIFSKACLEKISK